MSSAALQPFPTHHQTLKSEKPSTGAASRIRDSLVKTENPRESDGAVAGVGQGPRPALKRSGRSPKGQARDCGINPRRAPLRNASSRARIGVSKAYAPLLIPASIESDAAGPSQILDNSDTEMLLNIDDLIDDVDCSGESDGYTEAGASVASRRSRRGILGKRKNARAQEACEGNPAGRRSRRGERLDREDLMLIRGEGDIARKRAARRRRLCVLAEEERGGLDRKEIEKLVGFMAGTIDWRSAVRVTKGIDNERTNNGPIEGDIEDLAAPAEALSNHWRDVLSKMLVDMYPS
ncbi:hypothetical protein FGG08_003043 [Glutinoglossum americanum]|uniref:Uncharacterized protein n=1 Tax=Glutinoglossum americanum TaxID=1670608 RepID=A0A9P8L526_9PEZI|nr:hypothetical protein FGG08_003043 [Glutinoglossum americanum]